MRAVAFRQVLHRDWVVFWRVERHWCLWFEAWHFRRTFSENAMWWLLFCRSCYGSDLFSDGGIVDASLAKPRFVVVADAI